MPQRCLLVCVIVARLLRDPSPVIADCMQDVSLDVVTSSINIYRMRGLVRPMRVILPFLQAHACI